MKIKHTDLRALFVHDRWGRVSNYHQLKRLALKKLPRTYAPKRFLGSGAYADVHTTSKRDYVIKVGHVEGNFIDDAYFSYLKSVILRMQNNPFVPKVKYVATFTVHDTQTHEDNPEDIDYITKLSWYVVVLERLKPYAGISYKKRDEYFTMIGCDGLSDFDGYGAIKWTEKNTKYKPLKQFAKAMKGLFRTFCSDMHTGNAMWRIEKDQMPQLVITDPVAD